MGYRYIGNKPNQTKPAKKSVGDKTTEKTEHERCAKEVGDGGG